MRPGPCLRIPGISELSPQSRPLKSLSYSTSFSKPSSPQPSTGKVHHRVTTQTSAYHRIVSNKSLKKLALPSFLHESSQDLLLTKLPIGKANLGLSSLATDSSSIKVEEGKEEAKAIKSNPFDEFIKGIFSKKLSKKQVLLQVGKFQLTRGDLQSFDPKMTLNRGVIDACLRCIKHKNSSLFNKNEVHDRVLIFDTNFAQSVFTSEKTPLSSHKNPLKYEFIIFPLFIEFWTLVALDSKQKVLRIYNIDKQDLASDIFECIVKFVKQELKSCERKTLEATGWREFSFQCVQLAQVPVEDSPVLMLRIAYKISMNPNALVDVGKLGDFRYTLLVMLCKHGIQC